MLYEVITQFSFCVRPCKARHARPCNTSIRRRGRVVPGYMCCAIQGKPGNCRSVFLQVPCLKGKGPDHLIVGVITSYSIHYTKLYEYSGIKNEVGQTPLTMCVPYTISIDTGGTFTDCTGITPEGRVIHRKVLSSGCLRGEISYNFV